MFPNTSLTYLEGKLYLEYASDLKLQRAMKKRNKKLKMLETDIVLSKIPT